MNMSIQLAETESRKMNAYTVTQHSDHPRLRHITLDENVLDEFFARVDSIDLQNLEYLPMKRFALATWLAKCAGPNFRETLSQVVTERSTGGFTIGVQNVRTDAASFIKFGTAVGHLLGPSNHDAMSNNYYARFVVKDTDDSDSYLRQAYRLFTLHTDGTFVDDATDWLLMMKFAEKNAVGGESRLLHLDDWPELDRFATDPLGTRSFLYKAPSSKNADRSIRRPIFFESSFGTAISFIDQFVQPQTIEEAAYLQDMSASMEASHGTTEVPLPVGDLVVLNNYFWLHGRAPFRKNPHLHRELMRQRGMLVK